jgi:hypothetical protein
MASNNNWAFGIALLILIPNVVCVVGVFSYFLIRRHGGMWGLDWWKEETKDDNVSNRRDVP